MAWFTAASVTKAGSAWPAFAPSKSRTFVKVTTSNTAGTAHSFRPSANSLSSALSRSRQQADTLTFPLCLILQNRRAARRLHRFRLHQLRPGQVRAIQIELPFAVPSNLRPLVDFHAPPEQYLIGCLDAGHAERHVMHHTKLLRRRIIDVQHILQPIGALRDAHVHPVDPVVLHPTVPDILEPENVPVEVVGHAAVGYGNSDVNNAI